MVCRRALKTVALLLAATATIVAVALSGAHFVRQRSTEGWHATAGPNDLHTQLDGIQASLDAIQRERKYDSIRTAASSTSAYLSTLDGIQTSPHAIHTSLHDIHVLGGTGEGSVDKEKQFAGEKAEKQLKASAKKLAGTAAPIAAPDSAQTTSTDTDLRKGTTGEGYWVFLHNRNATTIASEVEASCGSSCEFPISGLALEPPQQKYKFEGHNPATDVCRNQANNNLDHYNHYWLLSTHI
jgi:hypothetical protein